MAVDHTVHRLTILGANSDTPAEHSALQLARSGGHARLHAMPLRLVRFSITRWRPSPAGHSVESVDRKSTPGLSSFQGYTRGRWHRSRASDLSQECDRKE